MNLDGVSCILTVFGSVQVDALSKGGATSELYRASVRRGLQMRQRLQQYAPDAGWRGKYKRARASRARRGMVDFKTTRSK